MAATVIGNGYRIWRRVYIGPRWSTCVPRDPLKYRHHRRVAGRSIKAQTFKIYTPYSFLYTEYILILFLVQSLVEFAIIFFTAETPNKIDSRTLVLASTGKGT